MSYLPSENPLPVKIVIVPSYRIVNGEWEVANFKYEIVRLAIPSKMRMRVLEKYEYRCQNCSKQSTAYMAVHHIIPICEAPWLAKTESNLSVICVDCHRHKQHHKYPKMQERQQIIKKYLSMFPEALKDVYGNDIKFEEN